MCIRPAFARRVVHHAAAARDDRTRRTQPGAAYISMASPVPGKELVAKLIHESGRAARVVHSFIPVNCGRYSRPSSWRVNCSATSAAALPARSTTRKASFSPRKAATLFLDEIADLPLHMQVKLLRVIQEKAVRPVGEQTEVAIDVRISVSHSSRISAQLVAEGKFSRGSLLPGQRHRTARTLAPRAPGRCSGTRRGDSAKARSADEDHAAHDRQGCIGRAVLEVYGLSRQRTRARENILERRDHPDRRAAKSVRATLGS